MKIIESHTLSTAEAQQRIQLLIGKLRQQFASQITNVKEDWEGNKASFSFTLSGFSIKGSLAVSEKDICLEGRLPLAAKFFQSTIEQTIRRETRALLDQPA